MVQAPAGMSDQDVALRLTIGHEKGPDPSAVEAFMNILTTGVIESWKDGPEGETEEERNKRIGDAVARETQRQVDEIIAAYRAQFRATTDEDIAAWNEALQALGTDQQLNLGAAEAPLSRIHVDPTQRGNSRQDLRLSLVGWRLGQLIGSGGFADGHAVAAWIRQNLGPQPPPQP